MKKVIFLIIYLHINIFIIFCDETPLIIDTNNEIWLYGQIIVFNGWSPNVRMIVCDNKIIGIDEYSISEELWKYLLIKPIKGSFKLKYIDTTILPYYDTPLLIFEIIEYKMWK